MPTYQLTRDPKTGSLESRFMHQAEAAAQQLADETGRSPRECFSDAALALAKGQPSLYQEHQALQLADRDPAYRSALSAELCAALDAVHRADQFAVDDEADTPAPSAFEMFTEQLLTTRYGGARSQYAAAATDAARERPDLYRNRHMPAEAFTQVGLRMVKEGAHIHEITPAALREFVQGLSPKDAKAALLVLAHDASEVLEQGLRGAGVDMGPIDEDRAALSARISPVEQHLPGAGAQTTTGTNPAAHSAHPQAEKFAYGVESYGTLQSVLAGGPIKILPLGKFHRDERVLNITEQDMRNIERNAAQGLPNFRVPVNVEHKGELGKVGTLKAIKYMPKGPDGPGLYAHAEWSDVGRQLITEQKFDGVSVEIVWDKNQGATFQDPKTGKHVGSGVVTGLALTNSPFFGHEHVALFHKETQ